VDVATHLLVPYAAALVALGFWRRDAPGDRPRAAVAAVFGIAGFAPDLDGLVDPLSELFGPLYWLQHRGVSHTLVGAPIFALATLGMLVLGARLWPRRMSLFAWRPALVPAAVLGSFTHLLLDGVTYGGVPLWWPFAHGRVTFPLFHWLVGWLLPISAIPLVAHGLGRLSRRRVVQAGALVVALLVVVGGVRLWARPWDEAEGARVYSTGSELEWVVATPLPNGTWELVLVRGEARSRPAWFADAVPPEAAEAVERAKDTHAYRGFLLGSFGPVVTSASRMAEGSWNVTFTDAAQRYEALFLDPRWTPAESPEEWGYVSVAVAPDGGARALHRGW
jgi:membrane-bound metal-dependent hydrolase YbcI (DUF457 family)